MKRIGVLTSGGDAPGMNAAIRAVVRTSMSLGMSVVGFKRGYNGILMRSENESDDFEELTARSVSGKIQHGGTFLMTARCQEFLEEKYQLQAIENMRALGVEGLVCIGGDGTFKGAADLCRKGFPAIGVPGTIDNDLKYTDYTIGFDTAVNTACESIDKIRETSDSHERVSLITVMGRNCGDIAIRTAFASGAELYMIPEMPWSLEDYAEKIKLCVARGKRSMMIVFAEGAMKSLTSDVPAIIAAHPELDGISPRHITSSQLAQILEVMSGKETRATVLGYIQRGGSPSAQDRILATRLGAYAAKLLYQNICNVAVGVREERLITVPIADVQNGVQIADEDLRKTMEVVSYMSK
ncbi:MAG: 6-phosphofructokinase [Clostridia bacterium]|nr:6-phosphofructokinase [Clostridia bacterium]